jgi:hypothetical protein
VIDNDRFENLRLELRRGCLILAVLAQLRSEQYGYTLRKSLADDGLAIDEGTLYPLLRRLESPVTVDPTHPFPRVINKALNTMLLEA